VKELGKWSLQWFKQASKWLEHIKRHPESPAGKFIKLRGAKWIQAKRAAALASRGLQRVMWDSFAGLTDTRVKQAKPQPRFEEAVLWARTCDLWWK